MTDPRATRCWLTAEDVEMLERAAIACDSLIEQARPKNVEWAKWVPQHLRQLAARVEPGEDPT
jgi:hypothetical protein